MAGECARVSQLHAPRSGAERNAGDRCPLLRDGVSRSKQPDAVYGYRGSASGCGKSAGGAGGHSDLEDGEAAPREDTRSHRRKQNARSGDARHQPAHAAQQDSRIRSAPKEIRMMTTTPIMQLLQGYLKVTSDRQQLVASNIANVDTPGYQTKDINFQTAMQQALNQGNGPRLTPASVEVDGLPERPDGNNVNVDR